MVVLGDVPEIHGNALLPAPLRAFILTRLFLLASPSQQKQGNPVEGTMACQPGLRRRELPSIPLIKPLYCPTIQSSMLFSGFSIPLSSLSPHQPPYGCFSNIAPQANVRWHRYRRKKAHYQYMYLVYLLMVLLDTGVNGS